MGKKLDPGYEPLELRWLQIHLFSFLAFQVLSAMYFQLQISSQKSAESLAAVNTYISTKTGNNLHSIVLCVVMKSLQTWMLLNVMF